MGAQVNHVWIRHDRELGWHICSCGERISDPEMVLSYNRAVCPRFKEPKKTMSKPVTEFAAVVDSGKRQEFETGSRRDTQEGKGRFDLMSPVVAVRDAKHLEHGAVKYGPRNWEKGQPLSRYLDSAMRHLTKFLEGHRDEDHLAAARWNIGGLMHTEEMIVRGLLPAGLNDLPDYLPKEVTNSIAPINRTQ